MEPPAAPRQNPACRGIVMFGVLLASYAINAMDRQLFPLLAPEVRRQYGFSLAAYRSPLHHLYAGNGACRAADRLSSCAFLAQGRDCKSGSRCSRPARC